MLKGTSRNKWEVERQKLGSSIKRRQDTCCLSVRQFYVSARLNGTRGPDGLRLAECAWGPQ